MGDVIEDSWLVDQLLENASFFDRIGDVQAHVLTAPRTWTSSAGATLRAEAGDYWVESDGRGWSVKPDVFVKTYDKAAGDRWRKVAVVRSVLVPTPFPDIVVRTLEGDAVARPGDRVLQNPTGERWVVSDTAFVNAYRPVPKRLYIAYACPDTEIRNVLVHRLGPYLEQVGWELSDDSERSSDDAWEPRLDRLIDNCGLAVLIVTGHSIDRRSHLRTREIPRLKRRGVPVTWFLAGQCDWAHVEEINADHALVEPAARGNSDPLGLRNSAEHDLTLKQISHELCRRMRATSS